MAKSWLPGTAWASALVHLPREQTVSRVCTSPVPRSHQRAAVWGYVNRTWTCRQGCPLTWCKTPHGDGRILGWEEKGGLASGWDQMPEAGSPGTTRCLCRTLRSLRILNLDLSFLANMEVYWSSLDDRICFITFNV